MYLDKLVSINSIIIVGLVILDIFFCFFCKKDNKEKIMKFCLIITVGIVLLVSFYIINKKSNFVWHDIENVYDMSIQETNAFNNQFKSFEGEQIGLNIKVLIDRIIANSRTYENSGEIDKRPIIFIYNNDENENISYLSDIDINLDLEKLKLVKNEISNQSKYNVYFYYDDFGLINKIVVLGNAEDESQIPWVYLNEIQEKKEKQKEAMAVENDDYERYEQIIWSVEIFYIVVSLIYNAYFILKSKNRAKYCYCAIITISIIAIAIFLPEFIYNVG